MEKGLRRRRDRQVCHKSIKTSRYLTIITRNFDFKEQAEVDKYYPQYYHKIDKVRPTDLAIECNLTSGIIRMEDQYTWSV